MTRPPRSPLLAALCLLVVACSGGNGPSSAPASSGAAPTLASQASTAPPPAATASPAPAAGSASGSGVPAPADWPVYHGDAARTGAAAGFPVLGQGLTLAWTARLDGAVYGQPLGVGGRVIAATENDSVYALDPAAGHVLWRRHLGEPVALATLPCGNIDPLGITSTAAYDPATDSLFVVAEIAGPRHILFALDAASGAVRWSRSVDLAGDDARYYQQRAALALGNGYVYIGFGGLDGDCGPYRGVVVGVPATGNGATIDYRVPVSREGAVWATGGPVLDPAGNLYVSTGNGSSTTTYDGSDSVVELSATLELKSRFAPSTWARDNATDADLGSLSPALVGDWVFIAGKSGTGYVLRQGALGGIGGQVSAKPVCRAFGGAAVNGTTVFVPCTSGVQAVRIAGDGSIEPAWQTDSSANGPPVLGGGAVWSVATDSGRLFALSPGTGRELAHLDLGQVPHFASPSLWDGLALVGTMAGVAAVRGSG